MTNVLDIAAAHAARYLESLSSRPIAANASTEELRSRLSRPLPEIATDPKEVIEELVRDTEGGLIGSASGRFFGWVIGDTLPTALAADWLTSAWDQNAASNLTAPAEAVVEEVCGEWMKELLGIPRSASFAFVTGCQMTHTTALAAARHQLLQDRRWDVEKYGLSGAPQLRILTTQCRHESIIRSARLLGIGTDASDLLLVARRPKALAPSDACMNVQRREQHGQCMDEAGDAPRRAAEPGHSIQLDMTDNFVGHTIVVSVARKETNPSLVDALRSLAT